ncbi:MAG TPA: hypothetical protein V6C78_20900, partial [Crinalium sp.]
MIYFKIANANLLIQLTFFWKKKRNYQIFNWGSVNSDTGYLFNVKPTVFFVRPLCTQKTQSGPCGLPSATSHGPNLHTEQLRRSTRPLVSHQRKHGFLRRIAVLAAILILKPIAGFARPTGAQ